MAYRGMQRGGVGSPVESDDKVGEAVKSIVIKQQLHRGRLPDQPVQQAQEAVTQLGAGLATQLPVVQPMLQRHPKEGGQLVGAPGSKKP